MNQPYDDKKDGPLLSAHIEGVAREEAARKGFDIATEAHGLFRAIAVVLSRPELIREAIKRTKEGQPSPYLTDYQDRWDAKQQQR